MQVAYLDDDLCDISKELSLLAQLLLPLLKVLWLFLLNSLSHFLIDHKWPVRLDPRSAHGADPASGKLLLHTVSAERMLAWKSGWFNHERVADGTVVSIFAGL